MDIRITLGNRHLLFLITFTSIILALGITTAYQSGGPPNVMGHSVEEMDWSDPLPGDLYVTGDVGIGTTNPGSYKLYVNGQTYFADDIVGTEGFSMDDDVINVYDDATSNSPYSRVNADSFHTNGLGVGQIFIEGRAIDANTWIAIGNGLAGGQGAQDVKIGNDNEIYVNTSANSVGIGTTTPGANKLRVVGAGGIFAEGGDICTDQGGGVCLSTAGGGSGIWSQSGSDIYYDTGNVGIGTTTPDTPLQVVGSYVSNKGLVNFQSTSGAAMIFLDSVAGSGSGLLLQENDAPKWQIDYISSLGYLRFYDHAGGSGTAMVVKDGGNVGIGTASPEAKLHVVGEIKTGQSYRGGTSASYTGNLGGRSGADAICDTEYPGSHMCTYQDMRGGAIPSVNGWFDCSADYIANAIPASAVYMWCGDKYLGSYGFGHTDCNDWTDNVNYRGTHITRGTTGIDWKACSESHPILCCGS